MQCKNLSIREEDDSHYKTHCSTYLIVNTQMQFYICWFLLCFLFLQFKNAIFEMVFLPFETIHNTHKQQTMYHTHNVLVYRIVIFWAINSAIRLIFNDVESIVFFLLKFFCFVLYPFHWLWKKKPSEVHDVEFARSHCHCWHLAVILEN